MTTRLKLQYIIYIFLLLSRNNAFANTSTTEKATFKIGHEILTCSGWLAILITKVCDNVYKIVKRDTSILMEKMAPKSVQEQKTKHSFLARERWRRVRRQVATECCDNPCTVGNLIMYCPDDSKVVIENPDLFEFE